MIGWYVCAMHSQTLRLIQLGEKAQANFEDELLSILNDAIHSSHLLDCRFLEDYRATYDAMRCGGPLKACLPGTRVAVLEQVKEWALNRSPTAPNIFWLSGLALTGKSAIAVSIADWADERAILGGSYFFHDSFSGRKDAPWVVFCTVAHDLASFDPSMRKLIVDALERDGDLRNKEVEDHFKHLIADPLLSWGRRASTTPCAPILLVIDGLDNYQYKAAVEILVLFLTHLSGPDNSHIRILVTSRPAPHIYNVFKHHEQRHRRLDLDEIPDLIVRQDIEYYLHHGLSQVYETLDLPCPEGWPDRHDFEFLVSSCEATFIRAKHALSFIGDSNARNPAKQLRSWLDNEFRDGFLLDLFPHWLEDYVASDDDMQVIAAILFLQDPLSLVSLADLLQMDLIILKSTLRRLHPFIVLPDNPHDHPRPVDSSLRDVLTNSSSRWYQGYSGFVDEAKQEAYMCRRCLEIMIEGLNYDTSAIRMDAEFNPLLRYACRHWAVHLSKAASGDSHLRETIDKFVQNHLLEWFHTMGLLHLSSDSVLSLQVAFEWSERNSSYYHSLPHFSSDLVPSMRMTPECAVRVYSLYFKRELSLTICSGDR